VGPTLALMQNLVPPNMRGRAVAVFLFSANVAGLALAPQLIGLASDLLLPHLTHPDQSLRIGLAISALAGVWAAFHFWAAGRGLPRHGNGYSETSPIVAH
jgi:sugar phosphate permease